MNPVDQSTTNGSVANGRNLDHVLEAFFRSEMPNPWPAFQPPLSRASRLPFPESPTPARLPFTAPAPPPRTSAGGSLVRSRLALAASVAILIGGGLLLPARLSGPAAGLPSMDAPTGKVPPFPSVPPDKDVPPAFLEQGADGRTGIGVTVGGEPSKR